MLSATYTRTQKTCFATNAIYTVIHVLDTLPNVLLVASRENFRTIPRVEMLTTKQAQ